MLLTLAALLLLQLGDVASQRQISGIASPSNTIHVELDVDLSYDQTTIKVSSFVPVTVQRYNDGGSYLEGQQPFPANFAKVLVTSDCDTSETSVVPNVVVSDDGSITVELDVPQDEADAMPFLEPSSYSAFWTWVSDKCGDFPTALSSALDAKVTALVDRTLQTSSDGMPVNGTICQLGSFADPTMTCELGKFCQLDMSVCNDESGVHNGTCAAIPQWCTEEYNPVCGCDGEVYSNACFAHLKGVSVSGMGLCPISDATTTAATEPFTATNVFETVVSLPSCDQGNTCTVFGFKCTRGTETCCGQTFDSYECTCEDSGNGVLQYSGCLYTDACLLPACCSVRPSGDLLPPAVGTCTSFGDLCETGVDQDYCCLDYQDPTGTATFCTKTGVKASSPTMTPTTQAPAAPTSLAPAPIADDASSSSSLSPISITPSSVAPTTLAPAGVIASSTASPSSTSITTATVAPAGAISLSTASPSSTSITTSTVAPTTTAPIVANTSSVTSASPTSITPSSLAATTLEPISGSPSSMGSSSPTSIATSSGSTPSSMYNGSSSPTPIIPSSLAPTYQPTVVLSSLAPAYQPTVVSTPSTGTSSPPSITTSSGASSSMIIGTCNSDEECTAVVRSRHPEQSSMGVELCQCYASSSIATFDECEGESDATCLTAKCVNTCEGLAAYCNNVSGSDVTGECALVASTTGTTPAILSIDGDFPTPAPNTNSSLVSTPPSLLEGPSASSTSAFGTRSFSLRFATTFMAIVVVFLVLQGNSEVSYSLSGLGKFAVVVMAVSSLYSRMSHSSKGGNIRKSNQGPSSPPRTIAPNLQTCSFNVEILVDGCTKSVEIDAPGGRVVDTIITNHTSTLTSDDGCRSTTELSANIAFPMTSEDNNDDPIVLVAVGHC